MASNLPSSNAMNDGRETLEVELTEVNCDCGYSSYGNMESGIWPNPWICPECGKMFSAETIRRFRRIVSSDNQLMHKKDENNNWEHYRVTRYYQFDGPEMRMALQAELERMRRTGPDVYIHEIVERLTEIMKHSDAKPDPREIEKKRLEAIRLTSEPEINLDK